MGTTTKLQRIITVLSLTLSLTVISFGAIDFTSESYFLETLVPDGIRRMVRTLDQAALAQFQCRTAISKHLDWNAEEGALV